MVGNQQHAPSQLHVRRNIQAPQSISYISRVGNMQYTPSQLHTGRNIQSADSYLEGDLIRADLLALVCGV